MAGRPRKPMRAAGRAPAGRKPGDAKHDGAIDAAMRSFMAGDRAAALEALRRVIAQSPRLGRAHRLAALVLLAMGETDRALYHAQQAVASTAPTGPGGSQALTMLGLALDASGDADAALDALRRATEANPKDAEAFGALGNALDERHRPGEALAAYERALALAPANTAIAANAALAMLNARRAREAVDLLRRFVAARPDDAHLAERLAFCLNYDDRASGADIAAAHRRWGELVERATPASPVARGDAGGLSGGPIRIAFVSPDFRDHSVARFLPGLFEHLDRDRCRVCCVFTSRHADATTERLRALADEWHDAPGIAAAELAELARRRGFDAMVDLSGHFAGHRLHAFAARPVPAQFTWLGYPATTGLSRIDARLVDSLTDPPPSPAAEGDARFASERLVRLDPCFLCYCPPAEAPEPARVKAAGGARTGPITFGSFNDAKKLSPATVDLWAAVLGRVPGSRLLLKAGPLADDAIAAGLRADFERRGVTPGRLDLRGHSPTPAEHLVAYAEVDVALDTFPYCGTTTTCEALWMGVPVVSRVGGHHAARVGLSLLTAAGLGDLAVTDDDSFVERAAALAEDRPGLDALRAGLRERVAGSALCDARGHAQRFAEAVRAVVADRAGPA